MADSTVSDISKMKVVELRKELKSRGLTHTGDKAELVSRLQAAMAQDDHGDITLDSDEIDSDGVLDEDDDKSQSDIALDDSAVEDALADQLPPPKEPEPKPHKVLKRKFTSTDSAKSTENKEGGSKKIVLNRSISITSKAQEVTESLEDKVVEEKQPLDSNGSSDKVKITADLDAKSKLELRAKRFGLSSDKAMSDEQRKEARKLRFGQTGGGTNTATTKNSNISSVGGATLSENLDKLKKRAERFGQSVSKIMTEIELKEKLEKRKAKFGAAAAAN